MNGIARRRRPPGLRLALGLCALASAPLAGQTNAGVPTTLAGAVARALDVHPSVEAAEAAARSAEAARTSARSARLPHLSVESSATRFQEPMLVAPLHGFDPTTVPDFDATLVRGTLAAGYTVFDGGRRGARIHRAEALVEAGRAARDEAEAALILRTADAWLGVLTARELVRAQESREAALDEEVDRARRLLDEGAAPRLVLLRAEADRASVQADGESARQALHLARSDLARILEVAPEDLVDAPMEAPVAHEEPPSEIDAAPPGLRAPAIARAQAAAEAAEAEVDAARAAWLPTLEAQLGYGLYAGGGVDAVAEWQAGVQIRYPIFAGGARAGEVERAEAEAARARAQARIVEDETARAVDAATASEIESRRRVAALESAVASFTELSRVERLALDEGAGTQSDWLRAEAGLFQSRAALAEARFSALRARLARARALGRLDLAWIQSLSEMTP